MKKYSEIVESIEKNKKELEFLETGFSDIDTFLDGGFMRKELIVVGAGTGMGKSFVAGQIFYNIARMGFKSAYFSLEISNEMIVSRLVGSIANIKPTRIMSGYLTEEENNNKIAAKAEVGTYEEFMYFYDDLYALEQIKKEVKDNAYEFIVIDFIGNVFAKGNDEYSRLSFVALELQKLAKETNCCILVLSQLSNAAAKVGSVVEYKGSGSIATVCDLGFFIERGETVGSDDIFTINLRKNRRGKSGMSFTLVFRHPGGKIEKWTGR